MSAFDVNNIFSLSPGGSDFSALSLQAFEFQYLNNPVYQQWCRLTGADPDKIKTLEGIPALPISFFKTHEIKATSFVPQAVFESSGTTQAQPSRHLVKELGIYRKSFNLCFQQFYGAPEHWCLLALLPSYLERQHSSLVMMMDDLIRQSKHPASGFYLDNHLKLSQTLQELERNHQKTILIGVTFGLLDFAAGFPQPLPNTLIMETGGMKGRRKELTREEVHQTLKQAFGVTTIHSEYGMTELLSQAYSRGNGRFTCAPWMKVLVRNEEDPLEVSETGKGLIQVIDLANHFSCPFIATEDVGRIYEDGSFEILGRQDNSDIRGCSLLVV